MVDLLIGDLVLIKSDKCFFYFNCVLFYDFIFEMMNFKRGLIIVLILLEIIILVIFFSLNVEFVLKYC